MVMKKLIAILVVFALAAGAVFAVDLGGEVIGTVNVLEGDNAEKAKDAPKVNSSATLNRIRIGGEGENEDGTFGGWARIDGGGDGTGITPSFFGNVWWKPIDVLLLRVGSNGYDGFFGKDGQTRWMFYQRATDPGVTFGGANAWGGGLYGGIGLDAGAAFFGGNGNNALRTTIGPFASDIFTFNLEIPFFNGGGTGDIFKKIVGQLDFQLPFGNIALTYAGGLFTYTPAAAAVKGDGEDYYLIEQGGTLTWVTDPLGALKDEDILDQKTVGGKDPGTPKTDEKVDTGTIYLYVGISAIEKLGIDIGFGVPLPVKYEIGNVTVTRVSPIAAGLGAQFGTGAFGIKARVVASFAGSTKSSAGGDPVKDPFNLFFDLLPNIAVGDNLKVFLSAGLGLSKPSDGDATIGFHANPYVWVGQEWGPSFWAGFKLLAEKGAGADKAGITWSVPIALAVSF